jgi:hypothetical protein
MKKMMLLFIAFALLGSVVFAQTPETYKEHPGHVDFGSFEQFQNAATTVEVSIKGPLLKFVSKATAHEDPELSDLIDKLLLIRVNVFSIEDNQIDTVNGIIQNVSKTLASSQWERMVRVQQEGEHVEVYIQFGEADSLTGLAVMALGDDKDREGENLQAVFVNIVGTIDPNQLGKLSAKFNIPNIDDLGFGETETDDEHKTEQE